MSSEKINIAIVDDQQLFRQGMISLLREFKELNIVFEAANGEELMEKLKSKEPQPSVILLDIEMPVMDGFETAALLKQKYPDIRIIILTMHDEEQMIIHLVEVGAHGFLPKNEDIEHVVDAIYAVHENGYYFNDKISRAMVKGLVRTKKIQPKFKSPGLSERELEILELICKEFTSIEIGDKVGLSARTVDNHRLNILKKIGARNTVGMVMYALKKGLITENGV
jgi:DNA-binding NarL/FixJ family response regulator